jgi:hypothetical protein
MKYQVDICIKASPHDDPDGAKIESHCFADYDKACEFAINSIPKDVHGEVHLHHFEEDEYGKEYYPEKMEVFADLVL